MRKNGFAITGIIYAMFLLFIVMLLGNLSMELMINKLNDQTKSSARKVVKTSIPDFDELIVDPTVGGEVLSGGTETYYGVYTVRTFLNNGTLTVRGKPDITYLIVAGGGGGARGGGGGGGLLTGNMTITQDTVNITIGTGGTGVAKTSKGGNGTNSILDSGTVVFTAIGGGGGGTSNADATSLGATGGSGGGSGNSVAGGGGAAIAGQGKNGASAITYGGGGGGAGVAGSSGSGLYAGFGGSGLASDITGTLTYYAGGGGGGGGNAWAQGGAGGGGRGSHNAPGTSYSLPGTDGLGGGGGGTNVSVGGSGGKGVVIIRHLTIPPIKINNLKTNYYARITDGTLTVDGVRSASPNEQVVTLQPTSGMNMNNLSIHIYLRDPVANPGITPYYNKYNVLRGTVFNVTYIVE